MDTINIQIVFTFPMIWASCDVEENILFGVNDHIWNVEGREWLEEYRPSGTLSDTDTFDYRAKLRYGRGLGLVSHMKRAKTVW